MTTSTPLDTKASVEAIYQAFGTGDIPAILDHLADDVSWDADWADNWGQTHADLRYFRPRRGVAGAAEFFADLAEDLTIHHFVVHQVIDGDDAAVARITIEFTNAAGNRVRDEELHLWQFGPDGKVTSFRHYLDTAKHMAAAESAPAA